MLADYWCSKLSESPVLFHNLPPCFTDYRSISNFLSRYVKIFAAFVLFGYAVKGLYSSAQLVFPTKSSSPSSSHRYVPVDPGKAQSAQIYCEQQISILTKEGPIV
jgi:hypothetical protein